MITGPLIPFESALERLQHLLAHEGWPTDLLFVRESSVLRQRPPRALLLRPSAAEPLSLGQFAYTEAIQASVPAHLFAIGHRGGTTYAYIRAIHELDQGEDMFISDGIHVSAARPPHTIQFCRSRVRWHIASWAEARRMQKALAMLHGAA